MRVFFKGGGINIDATIRMGQEIGCLPNAGIFNRPGVAGAVL